MTALVHATGENLHDRGLVAERCDVGHVVVETPDLIGRGETGIEHFHRDGPAAGEVEGAEYRGGVAPTDEQEVPDPRHELGLIHVSTVLNSTGRTVAPG